MLEKINLDKILFLDIETVPQYKNFNEAPEKIQELWNKKSESKKLNSEEQKPSDIFNKAGIYAEFGKIVCISVGIININEGKKLRVKSFFGDDEKLLLQNFAQLLEKSFNKNDNFLCAHNGKEFDFPYIARRMLINGIKIPKALDLAGKKPWEVRHLDTLELWKFGDYKTYTSLDLLTTIFNIPTPKDDIDGSMVCDIYWKENQLDRIVNYCQKDVVALVQLFLKYRIEELIIDKNIEIIEN